MSASPGESSSSSSLSVSSISSSSVSVSGGLGGSMLMLWRAVARASPGRSSPGSFPPSCSAVGDNAGGELGTLVSALTRRCEKCDFGEWAVGDGRLTVTGELLTLVRTRWVGELGEVIVCSSVQRREISRVSSSPLCLLMEDSDEMLSVKYPAANLPWAPPGHSARSCQIRSVHNYSAPHPG